MELLLVVLLAFSFIFDTSYANTSTTRLRSKVACPKRPDITANKVCADDGPCCGNSPNNRGQWCSRDIYTDYESDIPDTGVTREYWFEVGQQILKPDGNPRSTIAVNGSIPGPTIFADWGDWVLIHVYNNITDQIRAEARGVAIHWHGINQKQTNLQDGVPSITQCPIAPQHTMTYRWRATQYGTAWYHAHMSLQAWDGVFGGIIINGPASTSYDEDKGVLFLNDWSHMVPEEAYDVVQISAPQTLSNGLINGTNVWSPGEDARPCPVEVPTNMTCQLKRAESPSANETVGSRFSTEMERGKSYRIRLINAAIDNNFQFRVEGHNLTVIAMDMVPICPYVTQSVNIFMGQRYDIIITANHSDNGPFWIRSIPLNGCSHIYNKATVSGILYYGKGDGTIPKSPDYNVPQLCDEEPMDSLVPVVQKTVPPLPTNAPFLTGNSNCSSCESAAFILNISLNSPDTDGSSPRFFRWLLNGKTMLSPWISPTVLNIKTATTFSLVNMFEIQERQDWAYVLIINSGATQVDHPVHFHGHDFYILSQGKGTWNESLVNLNNPPRRDTAMLYGDKSYLLLAWRADNPGAWLMHCHLGWHTSMGFDWQFIEKRQELLRSMDMENFTQTCDAWGDYSRKFGVWQSASWDQAGV